MLLGLNGNKKTKTTNTYTNFLTFSFNLFLIDYFKTLISTTLIFNITLLVFCAINQVLHVTIFFFFSINNKF